jgi:hypothetical protein
MVNITERDGIVILEGEEFDLKVDNNRKIYIKKKEDRVYQGIGSELQVGYTSEEKKKYLYNLYLMLKEKKKEMDDEENNRDKRS